jgi:hypothetical protein
MRDFREGDKVRIELTPNGWPRWDGTHDRGSSGVYAKGEVSVTRDGQFWVEFAPHDEHSEEASWAFYQPSAVSGLYQSGSGTPELVFRPCTCGARNEDSACDDAVCEAA